MNGMDILVPIAIGHFQDALFQLRNEKVCNFPLWMVDHDILPSDKYDYVDNWETLLPQRIFHQILFYH